MIVKPKIEWFTFAKMRTPYVYWKNVIVILENPSKTLAVDAWRGQLSSYKPPREAERFKFTYRIGKVDDENEEYLECIAQELEKKLKPLVVRDFKCENVMVVLCC